MKNVIKAAIGFALVSLSASSFAKVYAGFPDIPADGIGFGSVVVDYVQGDGVTPPSNTTSRALGEPDGQSLVLGRSGSVTMTTAPMTLKGDGTTAADMYVYEATVYESWDTYVSKDKENWVKVVPVSSSANSTGTVKGYDIDSISASDSYPYIKLVDTSNSSGSSTAGADIDSILLASAQYTGGADIVDTDSRNGEVYNLEKDKNTGAIDVKKIDKQGSVTHITFTTDNSYEPVALSVQGNFDCNDEKDINVLVTRKSDNVPLNLIKDQQGNDIATIDNSVVN